MSSETDFPPPPVDIKKLRAHFESLQLGTIDNTSLDVEFEVNTQKKSIPYFVTKLMKLNYVIANRI